MANILETQIIEDGNRNSIVKIVGVLDTGEVTATDIVVPASFNPVPLDFRIDTIWYSVEEGLSVRLWWDASTDVYIDTFNGSGTADYHKRFGGLINNAAAANKTGAIKLSTEGWASTGVYNFTLTLHLVKMGVQ
jgi:hypothetical protein